MNITIFSGGTGSTQLVRGLRAICKDNKITHIINLYDDGKSTGICRKVCNVLGPSDMRKVHYLHYSLKDSVTEYHNDIKMLYENRYNFGDKQSEFIKAKNEIIDIIDKTRFNQDIKDEFIHYVRIFFEDAAAKGIYDFNDFSLANIIYAVMFKIYGIKETNKRMLKFLDINNVDVLVNSDINYTLNASVFDKLSNRSFLLKDEASIVSLNDSNLIIQNLYFSNENGDTHPFSEHGGTHYSAINSEVLDELNNTDLILFSSGTQWSSIIPTLRNFDIIDCLEKNLEKCIVIMNNSEDKDAKGVSASELLVNAYPISFIKKMKILFNEDANKLMRCHSYNDNYFEFPMGIDEKKRHDPIKLAKAVYSLYFGCDLRDIRKYKHLFVDFDDTIFSRDKSQIMHSYNNLSCFCHLDELINTTILSGNSFESIKNSFNELTKIQMNDIQIWADACSIKYKNNKIIDVIDKNVLTREEIREIEIFLVKNLSSFDSKIKIECRNNKICTCINVKPLTSNERRLLVSLWNGHRRDFQDVIARIVGHTSVEFVKFGNTKIDSFRRELIENDIDVDEILFIGDEYDGNDEVLFKTIKNSIKVKSVIDTNIIFHCLLEK